MSDNVLLYTLQQKHIDWLLHNGVAPKSIINPSIIDIARGTRAADGIFEHGFGLEWFAIPVEGDVVYWRPKTGEIATQCGSVFALGQEHIGNPGITALGGWLHLHESPLHWLRFGRRGIFVFKWEVAFEHLRDVERVSVPEDLVETYLQSMKPPRMPELGVRPHQTLGVAA